jgi:hypothetical protein
MFCICSALLGYRFAERKAIAAWIDDLETPHSMRPISHPQWLANNGRAELPA